MIKLIYTKEMQEQDELWNQNKDDLINMAKAMELIMQEAIQKGYKGKYHIMTEEIEVICEIFDKEEDRQGNYETGKDCRFSNCKYLIKQLGTILNEKQDKIIHW